MRRQLRGAVGAEVARRNQSAVLPRTVSSRGLGTRQRPATRLRPPQAREIVAFITVSGEPESTLGAVGELIERHHVFNLFRHRVTAEDVVVHRRDDANLVLLHPPGSALRDEHDLVIPQPSRYLHPIPLPDARSEMDALSHRFVYFIAQEDLRGKVLYLRRDGHYGLVQLGKSNSSLPRAGPPSTSGQVTRPTPSALPSQLRRLDR